MDNGELELDQMLDWQQREYDEQRQRFKTGTRSKSRVAYGNRRVAFPTPRLPPMVVMIDPDTGDFHTCGHAPNNFVRYRRDDTRYASNPAASASDVWKPISALPDDARARHDAMVLVRKPRHAPQRPGFNLTLAYSNGSGGWTCIEDDFDNMTDYCLIPE